MTYNTQGNPSNAKLKQQQKYDERCLRGERPAADCLGHGTAFEGSETEE
jgi:hypothetical protein